MKPSSASLPPSWSSWSSTQLFWRYLGGQRRWMETSWRVRARQFAMCTYNKCTFRCIVEALVQDRDRLGSQAACKSVTGQTQLPSSVYHQSVFLKTHPQPPIWSSSPPFLSTTMSTTPFKIVKMQTQKYNISVEIDMLKTMTKIALPWIGEWTFRYVRAIVNEMIFFRYTKVWTESTILKPLFWWLSSFSLWLFGFCSCLIKYKSTTFTHPEIK